MIHKFKKNNENFVLDVETGTILTVDDLAYELLDENQLKSKESLDEEILSNPELNETYKELNSLIDSGLLYSPSTLELGDTIKNRQIKALCLHIAHDCNLRCSYCFAGQGDFKGERSFMSLETAKKAIDFVIEESGNRHNIEIDFFGGEPLMNFDVVKETVAYARSREKEANKHFNFTLTTNGLLLDEKKQDWINENMDNVVLSIDGRKEVNDTLRKTVSGEGSYDYIFNNIKDMALKRQGKQDYYVRGTYTHYNLDFTEDVKHFVDEGIKSISIEPVVAEPGDDYEIVEEDLDFIKKEYQKLAEYNLNNDFNFFHFNIDLDGGPCVYKRISGCGAGTDYLAVTPDGQLFPCHQFVSNDDFKLGNLDEGLVNTEILDDFAAAGMDNKEKCQDCWARYFCGGGCHANAFNMNQSLTEPYSLACEMEKERVENAIMLYYQKNN